MGSDLLLAIAANFEQVYSSEEPERSGGGGLLTGFLPNNRKRRIQVNASGNGRK
jgi:hypothetical protein